MLPIKLVENPPKVRYFPTHMHMSVVERFANIVPLEPTPRITLT
jgi:hypothetical protein